MRSFSEARASWSSTAAEKLGEHRIGLLGVLVLEHVAVHRVAVADGRLEADRILDEVEQLADALELDAALQRDLLRQRVAVQFLGEHAPGPHHAPDLVDDVHGQADGPALVGDRPRHGLANPPGRVRGELEAHAVVELLHRADQAEVALLDEVEQRDAGIHVVPRDGHHEAQVALDEASLGPLVALVLAARELALLGRGQKGAVADLADVELERILGRGGDGGDGLFVGVVVRLLLVLLLGLFGVFGVRDELELRLLDFEGLGLAREFRRRVLHAPPIGGLSNGLERLRPIRGMKGVTPRVEGGSVLFRRTRGDRCGHLRSQSSGDLPRIGVQTSCAELRDIA